MAVRMAMARVLCGGSTGDVDFTSAGFGTPKAAMFLFSQAAANDTDTGHITSTVGMTDGTRGQHIIGLVEDAAVTTDAYTAIPEINNRMQDKRTGTASNLSFIMNFSSWITDGVRCNVSNAAASDTLVTCILFDSDDGIRVDYLTGAAQDVLVHYEDMGFEAGLMLTTNIKGGGGHNSLLMACGAVHNNDSGVTQMSTYRQDSYNQATSAVNDILSTAYGGKTNSYGWEFSNFDSSGFDVHARDDGATNHHLVFMAFERPSDGSDFWIGNTQTPTSTGNSSNTSPGFLPRYGIILQTAKTVVDTFDDTNAYALSYGAFDGTNAFSVAINSEDNVSPSNASSIVDTIPVHMQTPAGAAGIEASFVSWDATGWTLNYTAVLGSARQGISIMFQDPADVGGGGDDAGLLTLIPGFP